ncbi:MAG TPA: sigma factor [Vicinamibacterales bacterium]|jgi:DNA-directed RNA polymerase specialized sigma24 family protein|nr:sigma factor [Vicinamibacterales bacterium]
MSSWKDGLDGYLAALHTAARQGDDNAREEFTAILLRALRSILKARAPRLDDGMIADAAEDAILKCLRNQPPYDPARGALVGFVVTIAINRLRDLIRSVKRRRKHEAELYQELFDHASTIEEPPAYGLNGHHLNGTTASAPVFDDVAWTDILESGDLHLTPAEHRFLEARFAGEHRAEVLADLLGGGGRSVHEQRRLVKRTTDRLRLRLRRFLTRQGGSLSDQQPL